ncbi:MAG TPA: cupin domain-containing protein [Pseudolabrys sp.]|nr:cupin domain-containing protein [Pseudolabrys sp.]
MPKIDIDKIAFKPVGGYPGPFKNVLDKREKKQLGDAVGLTQFGVNITRLGVGGASSLRHWHREEDEFIYILEGEVVLIEDAGESVLKPGEAAGWKANSPNGHTLANRGSKDALILEVGTRAKSEYVTYPDVDLILDRGAQGRRYLHKNGEPY